MQLVFVVAILLYMFSAAAYFAYLFLQRDAMQRAGCALLVIGFAVQTVSIAWTLAATGHMAGEQSARDLVRGGLGPGGRLFAAAH